MIKWVVPGIYKASPEKVYAEIMSIGDSITPEQVVTFAENPSTTLHGLFEWDDKKAAHKYRLIEAQKIIRSIVMVDENKKDAPKIRCIVSTGSNDHVYKPTVSVVRNEDEYLKLLETAMRELAAFKQKYRNLKELETIISDIEEVLNLAS